MAIGVKKRYKNNESAFPPTRYFSKIQENNVAKATRGKAAANSGATDWVKGDVLSDQFLLECKTKTSNCESISIKKEWIDKNRQEMTFMGKPYQAIAFNFGPDEPYNENHYIIDEWMFVELMNYLKNSDQTS